mmetsp:Transcript_23137/g.64560  ORF Transcript_23137/g.64560 Transcript_23137/m.64560 type:complete len:254 (-) Transcript_23137:288-1049(-)
MLANVIGDLLGGVWIASSARGLAQFSELGFIEQPSRDGFTNDFRILVEGTIATFQNDVDVAGFLSREEACQHDGQSNRGGFSDGTWSRLRDQHIRCCHIFRHVGHESQANHVDIARSGDGGDQRTCLVCSAAVSPSSSSSSGGLLPAVLVCFPDDGAPITSLQISLQLFISAAHDADCGIDTAVDQVDVHLVDNLRQSSNPFSAAHDEDHLLGWVIDVIAKHLLADLMLILFAGFGGAVAELVGLYGKVMTDG